MLEYYESARHLNISSNQSIGIHGWQACANMIKKVHIFSIKKFIWILLVLNVLIVILYYFINYHILEWLLRKLEMMLNICVDLYII